VSESRPSVWNTIWDLKVWWMVPMALIGLLFVLLVVFADATGDAPFIYTIF
jgi:hypothetical protein